MDIEEMKRRCKIVFLPLPLMKQILEGFNGDYIRLPVFEGLPEGFTVMNIMVFPERDAIGLIIYHPSFYEVPLGANYPDIVLDMVTFKRIGEVTKKT